MSLVYLETDWTRSNPNNAFSGEEHTLTTISRKPHRVLLCNHGMFFSNSVVLRESDGTPLTEGSDYVLTYHHPVLSEISGEDIRGIIVVINPLVSDKVRLEYHALGLNGGLDADTVRSALLQIADDNVDFTLADIIGKPTAYVPEDHLHEYWQLYGMESTVTNIDRLSDVWGDKTTSLLGTNKTYGDFYLDKMEARIDDYRQRVEAHIGDKNNPHETTVAQLGLDNLYNWPLASPAQVLAKHGSSYLPIGGVFLSIESTIVPQLKSHLLDYSNPHELTLELLGLHSYSTIDQIFSTKLRRGQVAYSSKLLNGNSMGSLYNATRTNLSTGNLKPNTVFASERLGSNPASWASQHSDYVLTGNNRLTHLSTLFEPMRLNNSTWLYSPGLHNGRGNAWNAIVGRSAPPGAYIFAKFYYSSAGLRSPSIAVGRRNANGTTSSIL